jgi:hypothetical protein
MKDRLSKNEIRKDVVQESVQAVAATVGDVTNIIVNAVKDVAGSIGSLATDAFEIRDGARRARAQLEADEVTDEFDDEGVPADKPAAPAAAADPEPAAPAGETPKTDAE